MKTIQNQLITLLILSTVMYLLLAFVYSTLDFTVWPQDVKMTVVITVFTLWCLSSFFKYIEEK